MHRSGRRVERFICVGLAVAIALPGCEAATAVQRPTDAPVAADASSAILGSARGSAQGSAPLSTQGSGQGPGPAEAPQVAEPSLRLMAVGDIMLARSVGARVLSRGADVVFAGLGDTFDPADILIANLECSIATVGHRADKHYTFRAPPATVDALALAGVDVVGQANNHALDYGTAALRQTRSLLAAQGIAVAGAGRDRATAHAPVILERNGLRVAVLDYVASFIESTGFDTVEWEAGAHSPGVAIARPAEIAADVAAAKQRADLVVVMLHAGFEGVTNPNGAQRQMTRAAIHAGATLVVGAHPHVLQGYRSRGGHLIAYGVGNFVFDGMTGIYADTAILDVRLSRAGVTSFSWIPVMLVHGLPRLATGADATRILARIGPI